jgi:hypothetical protein
MKSHEALHKAIGGKTVEFAKRLGLSSVMLNKWQEPTTDWSDSGAFNPLDRIETIIETALQRGRTDDKAFAPIYFLAERFGLVVIPVPQCDCLKDLHGELMETIKEFGHLASAASEAMADGWISRDEAARIEAEGNDLLRHVSAFIQKAKESVK